MRKNAMAFAASVRTVAELGLLSENKLESGSLADSAAAVSRALDGREFLAVDQEIIKLCKSGAFLEFPSSRFFDQCVSEILSRQVSFYCALFSLLILA